MKRIYTRLCSLCVFLPLLIGSAAAQQVATPVLNPGAKTATAALNITIVTETDGASIRYTTDNSTPNSTVGTLYTGPVTVSSTQTIKAIAYKTAMTDSDVASAAYTIVAPPTISSISPTSGSAGTPVTITGTGFGSTQGSGIAWLGTTLATVTSWSDTQVIATIALNANSDSARIRQNGTWSNDTSIDIAGISIDSLTPDNGLPGTSVTIAGSGFGSSQGTSQLLLGTALGTITSWSDTQIVATVATGAQSGNVQVMKGGRPSNTAYFTINTPRIDDVSPVSGTSATTVTITGANFGSIQGSSTLRLGSEAATILTWTDTEITATPTSGAKSGIVRIDQSSMKSNTLKFSVPDGLGAISTLAPDIINMVVGETRPIQALDSNGAALTGLTWASSDTGVVTLSASDPPILTAVAAGHVTITAGSASADVTVSATDFPLGTILWSNTLDGQSVDQILSAVPSSTGVADVFAIHQGESSTTVHAVTADGITAWMAEIPDYNVLVPDFQGGLVDIRYDDMDSISFAKVDGLTGELGTPYSLDSDDGYGSIAVHPDGTAFVLVSHNCESCSYTDDTVIGIDMATGTQKFSLDAGRRVTSSRQVIIAGNGDAYVPYVTAEDGADNVHWKIWLLRIDTSGSATRIPIYDRYEYVGVEIPYVWFGLITNADSGVLLTWLDGTGNEGTFGTAVITGSSVTSMNLGASLPEQDGPLMPILQAQDGSFIGTNGLDMVAFDSSGTVRWSAQLQPTYDQPVMALADGGVLMQSGLIYDQDGALTTSSTAPTQSWRGNAYQIGSVERLAAIPVLGAQSFWAQVKGNPSGNNASARPWSFILNFDGGLDFNFTPAYPQYLSALTTSIASQASDIKKAAVAAFKEAYKQWPVVVVEGTTGTGDVRVQVQQVASDGQSCGSTDNNHIPHNQSYVYYDCTMKNAQAALSISITNAQEETTALNRRDLIQSIGRGIGNHAAHEAAHLFLGACCRMDTVITTSDQGAAATYNHGNADGDPNPQTVDSDPAPYTGLGKDGAAIHWESTPKEKLEQCLTKGWRNYGLVVCVVALGI